MARGRFISNDVIMKVIKRDVYFCWPTKRPEIGRIHKFHNRWDLLSRRAYGK
jgi:hypothetical protein